MFNIHEFLRAIRIKAKSALESNTKGELEVRDSDGKLVYHDGSARSNIITEKGTSQGTDSLENKDLNASNVDFVDNTDTSKKVSVDTSGAATTTKTIISTSQTVNRTISLPDADDTLVGKATTDTLTNKTIDSASNTITVDADNATISNIEVDNLKAGVLDTDLSSVSASDDTLPSAKATKAYADSVAGEVNTASNLGAGEGTFSSKSSEDLQFKSIVAGSGISLSSDANEITINKTGGVSLEQFEYGEDLTAGDPIEIYDDTGAKVRKLQGTSTPTATSRVEFTPNNVGSLDTTYDSVNNRVVHCYQDTTNSSNLYGIVGSISVDGAITYGTPTVLAAVVVGNVKCVFEPNSGKVVIMYTDGSDGSKGTIAIATVVGLTISAGTPVQITGTVLLPYDIAIDTDTNQVGIFYSDVSNSAFGTGVMGAVVGTSMTFGTPVVFESLATGSISAAYDTTNDKFGILYVEGGTSYARSVTVVGTVPTFSARTSNEATSDNIMGASYDSTNDIVVGVYLEGSGVIQKAVGMDLSGATPSLGTAVSVVATGGAYAKVTSDILGNTLYTYHTGGGAAGHTKIITSAGTVLSVSSGYTLPDVAYRPTSIYMPNNAKFLIGYIDGDTVQAFGHVGEIISGEFTNTIDVFSYTSANFMGVAQTTALSGTTNDVALFGNISTIHSGQTAGDKVYIDTSTGGLTTVDSGKPAGVYTNATDLIITKNPPASSGGDPVNWQKKLLSGSSTTGVQASSVFNNLEIGKTYRFSMNLVINNTSGASNSKEIKGGIYNNFVGGTSLSNFKSYDEGTFLSFTFASTGVFIAAATTLELHVNTFLNTAISGTESWLILEELPNHSEVTTWT